MRTTTTHTRGKNTMTDRIFARQAQPFSGVAHSKPLWTLLVLSTAFSLPSLASARPVTLTTTLRPYAGNGAYLAVYLSNPAGTQVRTLWVAGPKTKYHKHLRDWSRAVGNRPVDGLTGASVGSGRTLSVTVDLADALFDAGYRLNVDAAVEDLPDSPHEVSVPLTRAGAGKATAGRRYVAGFTYSP